MNETETTKVDNANALLLHIEHSKPIEVTDFVTSLNAIGSLFSCFTQNSSDCKELAQAKLYVEKIEYGCIDIILCETVSATMIPFLENINIILEFSIYIKNVLDYFTKGKGEKPDLSPQEGKNFKDLLTMTAGDNNGEMSIGAINKYDKQQVFQNCTFNFTESNCAQNQIAKVLEELKSIRPVGETYKRQLMTIYQMRSDMNTDIGNKAVIDSISKKRVGVVFETDELKEKILHSDSNPTKKAFLVDVEILTSGGKLAAYKVMALHDIVDLEDN